MEYVFPKCGFAGCIDQFMLGNEILVAPVVQKGATVRSVILPEGKWQYFNGDIYEGGQRVDVPAPIEVLPYFTLIK